MAEAFHSGGTTDKTVSSKAVQNYETPDYLIKIIEDHFGHIGFDLAADAENTKCSDMWFGVEDDSLAQDWFKVWRESRFEFLWLNPPFKTVRPWMEKCRDESKKGARILSLTKASIGSAWYREVVAPNAASYILTSRVTFVGCTTCFTQDLMISEWGTGKTGLGFWDWKRK